MEFKKLECKKICSLAFAAGFVLLCASCAMSVSLWNPYCVTDSYVVVGKEDGFFNLAGAYIDIVNNSEKEIVSADISFLLYDAQGNPAGSPTNKMECNVDLNLLPCEETEVVISLDKMLGAHVEKKYNLDFVYLTKIVYEDGTCWVDPMGATSGW